MTDTTDIKALRELLCHEDLESEYHVGVTVTTLRLLLSKADQLEAERQRADEITEQYVDRTTALSFAAQRAEKAEKSNAFLKEQLAQQANFNPDWDMLEACRESWREVVALLKEREAELEAERQRADELVRAKDNATYEWGEAQRNYDSAKSKIRSLEAEIAALKAKLANPVVLSDCNIGAVSHMAHWYSKGECIAWVAGVEHAKKQILEAGFTFKEEAMTNTTDIAALREALCKLKSVEGLRTLAAESIDQLEAERQRDDEARKTCDMYRDKFLSAEAELAALKAKLANPVVLPNKRDLDPAILTYTDVIKAINAAGFTVKEK